MLSARPTGMVNCSDPGIPANSIRQSKIEHGNFTFGTVVFYDYCGHPGSPPNGVLTGEKFTFGSTVRYSCLGGRQLKGESSRMCQLNGMWSAPMPFCSGEHFKP
ncbi:hypothetical protein GOODEAATRI_013117 [Goodea atripinnis]|uniref:Sushi domain-containing protein n=1 Tax=Goodea atripinnis TaxID=208336 RepID=A0ABV0NK25_9TELE